MGFELGGRTYEIERASEQKRASFRQDGREIATNQEADEALWEVLGVAPRLRPAPWIRLSSGCCG